MDIYRVHVSLRDIEPAIWRRIELSSQRTLKQLHRVLQIAMGWRNDHLHEYIITGGVTEHRIRRMTALGRSFARQAFGSRPCYASLARRSSMFMISETTGNMMSDWRQFFRRSRI